MAFHSLAISRVNYGEAYHGNFGYKTPEGGSKRHGHGVLITKEGHRYTGEFKEGKRDGKGTMVYNRPSGYEYHFRDLGE